MRRSRRRSRRQKRQFVGDIVCLETFKVSEAHRAMWYTSGTLEPNPADHISDCVMSCTPGTCQRGRLATNRFCLKNRCGPFHPPSYFFCNICTSEKNSKLPNLRQRNAYLLSSRSSHTAQPAEQQLQVASTP